MAELRLFAEPAASEEKTTRPATRRGEARVVSPVRNQAEMVVCDLDSTLPAEHPARSIWAFLDSFDLSAFYADIKAVATTPGRPTTDPQVLLALWLYATAEGFGSARYLGRLCEEHDAYRWLRGGVPINYHMLADFRVQHGKALNDLLTKMLAAMVARRRRCWPRSSSGVRAGRRSIWWTGVLSPWTTWSG